MLLGCSFPAAADPLDEDSLSAAADSLASEIKPETETEADRQGNTSSVNFFLSLFPIIRTGQEEGRGTSRPDSDIQSWGQNHFLCLRCCRCTASPVSPSSSCP